MTCLEALQVEVLVYREVILRLQGFLVFTVTLRDESMSDDLVEAIPRLMPL